MTDFQTAMEELDHMNRLAEEAEANLAKLKEEAEKAGNAPEFASLLEEAENDLAMAELKACNAWYEAFDAADEDRDEEI